MNYQARERLGSKNVKFDLAATLLFVYNLQSCAVCDSGKYWDEGTIKYKNH